MQSRSRQYLLILCQASHTTMYVPVCILIKRLCLMSYVLRIKTYYSRAKTGYEKNIKSVRKMYIVKNCFKNLGSVYRPTFLRTMIRSVDDIGWDVSTSQ